ncbi:MAG: hypothetical protein V1779_17360 [bacterium]
MVNCQWLMVNEILRQSQDDGFQGVQCQATHQGNSFIRQILFESEVVYD